LKANSAFWNTEADIFIPAAGSRLIDEKYLDLMIDNGLELISAGANVPTIKKFSMETFYKRQMKTLASFPDFSANCGMARVLPICGKKYHNYR
jgi:glutamate dehydrogenase (NAD(P)+)